MPQPLAPIPVVILAAGASRRLGRPKQLVSWEGETLLRRAARTALEGGGPVFVVVGHSAEAMRAELAELPVQVVLNEGWEEGMASSLRAGLEALPPGVSGVLLLACDQPAVDGPLLEALREAHRRDPQVLAACAYEGVRGIPALFPARLFPALRALRGDRGARGLLRGEAGGVEVPFEGGGRDVDRPEDLPGGSGRP